MTTPPQCYGSQAIMAASGIRASGDTTTQASLRSLAWRMVETDDLPNGRRQTILSRAWVAGQGWSVALFLGLTEAEDAGICETLASHGHVDLLGTPVDVKLAGDAPSLVWHIPNAPAEEGVPAGNFLLAHSGLATLLFPETGAFGLHTDEDGEVRILAGPADLVRAVTHGAPEAATRRFLDRAGRMESAPDGRFPARSLSRLVDQYAPYLLRDQDRPGDRGMGERRRS